MNQTNHPFWKSCLTLATLALAVVTAEPRSLAAAAPNARPNIVLIPAAEHPDIVQRMTQLRENVREKDGGARSVAASSSAGDKPPTAQPGRETEAEGNARHSRIAGRRAGPVVIVHRGASAFAPENSLKAYAAAMDYGADGCEVDVRRTRDGVLVLFHDDMLDHLTYGFGAVGQLTYRELLALRPERQFGRVLYDGVPTFVKGA